MTAGTSTDGRGTSIDWDQSARNTRDAAGRADPEHHELLTVIRLAAELQPVR